MTDIQKEILDKLGIDEKGLEPRDVDKHLEELEEAIVELAELVGG